MNPQINAIMYPHSKNGNSFADGMEFQDFVVEQFNKWGLYIQIHSSKKYQYERGESVQRVEIKLDRRCTETGRLSIEVGERTSLNNPWVRSGIYRNDNTCMYIQGNKERLYLFDRKVLARYHKIKLGQKYEESPRENPTVRKFYLPFDVADQIAITRILPQGEPVDIEL